MSISLFGKLLLLLFPMISKDENCVASSFTKHAFDDLDLKGEDVEAVDVVSDIEDVEEEDNVEDNPAFLNANGNVCVAERASLLKEGTKVLLGDFVAVVVVLPSGFASISLAPLIVNSSPTVRAAPSGGTSVSLMYTSEDS